MEPQDVRTPEDVIAAASDEQIAGAYNVIAERAGGDQGVDRQLYQITGRDPTALTRREKAELLIEFGLRLAANSSGSRYGQDLFGAAADAGLGTLGTARQMRASKVVDPQAQRKAQLENDLLQAQIDKTRKEAEERQVDPPHWVTYNDDASGYSYVVNANDPTNRIKLGKLTEKDREGERTFEFDRKINYYVQAYGVDADGNPLFDADGKPLPGKEKEARAVLQAGVEFANRSQGMNRSEAFKFATETALDMRENGLLIDPERKKTARQLFDEERANIMDIMGYPQQAPRGTSSTEQPRPGNTTSGVINQAFPQNLSRGTSEPATRRGGNTVSGVIDREVDVTEEVPPEVIAKMPEGQQQANSYGQIVVRRGDRVYYVGQQPRP